MSSITFIQSSSLLMLLILFGFSSATNKLLTGTQVLNNLTDKALNNLGVSEPKLLNVTSDLCIFYQTIHEYREVTANDTSNVTKAIHIVLNETYSDSCQWLKEKLNRSDYDCADISSIDVTEICTFLEASNAAKDLLEVLDGDDLKETSGKNFTIECENGNCASLCALLGDGVCGCNNSDTKSTLICNSSLWLSQQ